MLQEQGHEVIVIAPIDKYISYQEQYRDVTHVPIRKLRRDSVNPIRDIQLTRELIKVYRKYKPDIVIHYTIKPNIYGGFAAGLAGIPSVAVVTGLGYAFIHNGVVKHTAKQLYKWSTRFHRKVVFENRDDLDLFVDLKLMPREKGISVQGCGVDTDYFKPDENAPRSSNEFVFTFVGRMLYDKGIREFIEAAKSIIANYPHARFWIVGELDPHNPSSITERDLVQWVKDKEIIYLGAKDNIKSCLEDSDCVVLPSYREGMSRVIMEAMSMERPVITTDTAGCREAVDHGENGLLVPVGDAEALAEAMIRVLEMDPSERQEMGVNGRQKAISQFDQNLVAEFYRDLLDSVIEH